MKILLISLGTRGDIEPFLAQAELLSQFGHDILCLFPEQFKDTVEKLGYGFLGFDRRFLELLESQSGKKVMGGGGGLSQLKGYFNLVKDSFKIQGIIQDQQRQAIQTFTPDKVLFHSKALYCYLAALVDPTRYFLLTPIPCITHPTYQFSHIGLAKWKFSEKWNFNSFGLVNRARHMVLKKYWKKYLEDFKGSGKEFKNLANFEKTELETLYTISPRLFPKPKNWPNSAHLVGFYQRNQQKDYQPAPELTEWLANHPKAILVTFGSMSNPKPKEHSQMIIDALVAHQIPAIINLSWGGLSKVENSPESIFYVDQIPYDWVLPQLYGMIHHGGSGTTHYAALSGCVQFIIPHIIDQYFWNRLINERGLGPLGSSIHQMKEEKFESDLMDFYTNSNYKVKASQVALQMKSETDPIQLTKLITQ